jgi:polyribonucleotide nucleotidyltransferase
MGGVHQEVLPRLQHAVYAVGEVRPIRGPGRREIGHGALAERSVAPVLPDPNRFPYTIRVVSDILESNGSSSMASVCGATLSMMDAGVPISDPVGGISIGLVQDEKTGRHVLLTDIIGDEDHFGDMDFKVAGTQHGVTGIQLDLKNQGITAEIIRETLDQALEARVEILRVMLRAIKRPREEISVNAPRLIQIQINPEKIGLIIGPGGKTIRRIQEETGAKIDIEDTGIVTHRQPRGQGGRGGARPHPGHDRGGPGRQALRGPRHLDQGLRRLRRDHPRQGRPGPHQRAAEGYVGSVSRSAGSATRCS